MVDYKNKKVIVVGLGKTGLSCVDYLLSKQAMVYVMDTQINPINAKQLVKNVSLSLGELKKSELLTADLIVISPGISTKIAAIQNAIKAGIEVIGDIELFCREATKPIIAITGSNGKTTVTTLVTEMGRHAGLKIGMGGNIGIPALSLLAKDYDYYVLELSSFQLETTYSLRAKVATVLNISEDHMDRYVDLEAYRQAKLSIYNQCEIALTNKDDPLTYPANYRNKITFGMREAGFWLNDELNNLFLMAGKEKVIAANEMKLVGLHNYLNALSAIALADSVKISRQAIISALRCFSGLEHRFQLVNDVKGIRWINDSKATNVGSTVASLTGLKVDGKLHLLLGGDGKGADFSKLAPLLEAPNIFCYCFGKDGEKIATFATQSQLFSTMEQAVNAIRKQLNAGDVVLLSPACASLDQFENFEQRGKVFTQLAKLDDEWQNKW